MWSVQGRQVVHQCGLSIEVVDGTFSNPMDLSIKGDKGFSAPQLALMIREGIDYAVKNQRSERKPSSSTRPILKLKRD